MCQTANFDSDSYLHAEAAAVVVVDAIVVVAVVGDVDAIVADYAVAVVVVVAFHAFDDDRRFEWAELDFG